MVMYKDEIQNLQGFFLLKFCAALLVVFLVELKVLFYAMDNLLYVHLD